MDEQSPFPRVTILGTGLIGCSFGLALRRAYTEVHITGWDREGVANRAVEVGATHAAAATLADAARGADLVYIALPVGTAIEILPQVAEAAKATALVTDACGTKSVICSEARRVFDGGARFLGGHPIAGKETSGMEHADAKLFCGAPYVLASNENESDPRVQGMASVARAIGAEPVWCDADTHDWALGIVSHLPQLVSVALARVILDETDETGLPVSLAGAGVRDALRLAGSPYDVWRDICLTNRDNIGRALDRIAQAIEYLRQNVAARELETEFRSANDLYKLLRKLQ